MQIHDRKHLEKLVSLGMYFGYSTESIVQFIVDYNTVFVDEIDYRTHGATLGTGHVCSTYEALTMTYDEIVEGIESRRYSERPFPSDHDLDDHKEVDILMRRDFFFNKKVLNLVQYITDTYDIGMSDE